MQLRTSIRQHSYFLFLIQFLFNLLSHKHKNLLDILSSLGTSLKEINSNFLCQSCSLLKANFSITDIRFISDQYFEDTIRCVQLDLFDPIFNIFKRLSLIDCVCEYDSHGASVVGLGNGFEFLLTGCIPNLQSYFLFSYHDGFGFEVDADGGEVGNHEVVLTKF